MSPIQQMLLGVGAVATKTYVDDVFSTYLTRGNATARSVNTGIDMTEGGLIWSKCRTDSHSHFLYDTERGVNKFLRADGDNAEYEESGSLTAFNNNGFSLGTWSGVNQNSADHAHFSFRKAKGFFDVVTWDGNNTAGRQIAHNLGCVPGCIIVKSYVDSDPRPWRVYHRGVDATAPEDYALRLDESDARSDNSAFWNDTAPTSSVFTVGNHASTNMSNKSYVAYLFAGGKGSSDSAVSFDGSSSLTVANGSGIDIGTNDFTMECFINVQTSTSPGNHDVICASSLYLTGTGNSFTMYAYDNGGIRIFRSISGSWTASAVTNVYSLNTWTHVAWVRKGTSSNNNKVYVNGEMVMEFSDNTNYSSGQKFYLGASDYDQVGTPDEYGLTGKISNFRFTNGQALYTTNFNPPHDPLTTSSQGADSSKVKLLCCNGSSTTSSTVTAGTITSTGSTSVTTNNSIFDDTAANVFGDAGDQNVIKCGSYVGNGNADGPEIFLGWEPSWLLIKRSSGTQDWMLFDSMRGLVTNGGDTDLRPNTNNSEGDGTYDWLDLTSTGFKLTCTSAHVNDADDTYIYMCIRRPDGYVGKPPELGTGVFAMDTGAGSSTTPNFDSGFPVDFAFSRDIDTVDNWYTFARLTGKGFMYLQTTNSESDSNDWSWDSNVGWQQANWGSDKQSWMFKRHAGMDCIAFKGNSVAGRQVPHSLSKTPEMIWVKRRTSGTARDWMVYHKGLNGGTNPEQYGIVLNDGAAEVNQADLWNDTAHSSTYFTLGGAPATNSDTIDYLALLFASVEGISSVGSYTGNGSSTGPVVTVGFQPRLVIIKRTDSGDQWFIFDTLRGISNSGNDKLLKLSQDNAQTDTNRLSVGSTNFSITSDDGGVNQNNGKYIYYAHA